MAAQSSEPGPIAVYGASGYTGRLVAAELRRRGADLVLAGRNRAKLEIVAEDVGGGRVEEAGIDDADRLRSVLRPCAAVIACAGPFRQVGRPVVAAAVEAATHYLDTTGEQAFMSQVFEDFGEDAERAGVALVPAMGFDYAPGDMLAALIAEGMGPLDEIVLAYAVLGWDVIGPRASRGTARSALGILAGDEVEWTDGELRRARGGLSRGTFEFPEPVGRQRVIRYPSGEPITVPRHVSTRSVRTLLTAATVMPSERLAFAAPLSLPPFQLLARTPVRRVLAAMVSRLPEGPSEKARRRARFTVVCEAVKGERRRRGVVTGSDVYGTTARVTVEGALRMAAPGYDRRGALAPSQAFEPRDFLESMRRYGLDFEVEAG